MTLSSGRLWPLLALKRDDRQGFFMSWRVLMTKTSREMDAAEKISRMAVTAVCPIVIERRTSRGKKVEDSKPLYPSYIFIDVGYVPPWLLQQREKYHIVSLLQTPISDSEMRMVMEMSGDITVDEWRDVQKFHRGESVKLRSGIPAIVDEVRGKKLILLVELLGKIHRKTVMAEHVEAAE